MTRQFLRDAFGFGFLLWLVGYVLGIVLFMIAPQYLVGWIIMPIGTAISLWILIKKIKSKSPKYYALVGLVWLVLAVVLDYFLLVKLFKPADGYYKLDVYLYYSLTFILPLLVGWRKSASK